MSFWKNPFKSIAGTVSDGLSAIGKGVGSVVGSVVTGVVDPFISGKTHSAIAQQNAQVDNQLKLNESLFESVTPFNPNSGESVSSVTSTSDTISTGGIMDNLSKYIPYVLGVVLLGGVAYLIKSKK